MRFRSLLFVPADSERKLARGLSSDADALILDLQDGVAAPNKAQARSNAATALRAAAGTAHPALWVRINPLSSAEGPLDVAAVAPARPFGLVVPMVEHPEELARLSETLRPLEAGALEASGRVRLMALLETPRAILSIGDYPGIPLPRLEAVAFGAEDLAAALGLQQLRGADGDWCAPLQVARAQCLLLAHALGLEAIEAVTTQFRDLELLRADCARAAAIGFTGKLAVHPEQLPMINAAFTPSHAALARARRVVAAFAARPGVGALSLDGALIDGVHLRAARRLLGEE